MSTKDAMLGSSAAAVSSGGPPVSAMTSNAVSKKILHQKRWVCDVCKVKWFLDFNEACAHEEQCKGAVKTQSSLSVSGTASKTAPGNNKRAEMSSNTTVMSAERKDDGASPTITPPPQSKKAAAILAAARAKARGIPPVEKVETKQKSIDIEILSDTSDTVNEVQLVEDSNGKRKSKRLRDATPPAKSNHDCSSSNEMVDGKKKNKKPKAVMPKTKKVAVNKSNTSFSMSKKTDKKGGGPIASIFLPKSKQQQKQTKGDPNHNSKKRAVETSNVQSNKRNQRSAVPSTKSEVLEIDSSSDDDDEVVVVETASKQMKMKKKKNAVLGLSKEQLREHQAADFFARRKKKAEEEKERQRKRNEARMARLNSKEMKSGGDTVGDVNSSSNDVPSVSLKTTATVAGGATTTKKTSFLQSLSESSPHNVKTIPAPRFPCPSHIIPRSDDSDVALELPAGASYSVLSQTPKFQHSKQSMTTSSEEDDEATMPLSFLDEADLMNSESSIFSSFFSCNAIKMIKDDDESPALASQLWVDKYTMTKIPDDVIGQDNKEASKKLVEFVEEWKVRRHRAMQSMGQVKRKKKKRRKKKSSNGYDSDDSFLDDGGLENVFFISGPTASGKTRLVHAVAEQCECVVIEINTAEQRSGQALKKAVQETTQSHSSLAMSKRKQVTTGFFEKTTDDLVDCDNDRYDSESDDEPKEDGHSLTIILIDEGEFNCVLCSFRKRCDVIAGLNSCLDLQSTFYLMMTLHFGRHLLS